MGRWRDKEMGRWRDGEMERKIYCNAEDLRIVRLAEEVCDGIWDEVKKWDWFAKKTMGSQLVNASDSIGANICEGHGRHHKNDNIRFLYISRGSLEETLYWLRRSLNRRLINQKIYHTFVEKINNLRPQLNAFIQSKFRKSRNASHLSISPSKNLKGGESDV